MSVQFGEFKQSVVFSGTFNYDGKMFVSKGQMNYFTHRENIVEALREFSVRNSETAKYLISTFGFMVEVVNPPHYSNIEDIKTSRPHFNVKANGKTYHIFTTKNTRKIVAISEILMTEFSF